MEVSAETGRAREAGFAGLKNKRSGSPSKG